MTWHNHHATSVKALCRVRSAWWVYSMRRMLSSWFELVYLTGLFRSSANQLSRLFLTFSTQLYVKGEV